ncbi:MAG: VCBS repeat-containing protein, partial [Verrucomicrobiota bacterium]
MIKSSIIAAGRLWGALAWALLVATARGGTGETNTFGFTGPEIYPMENAVTLLHAADMDGDGLNDLIVVNNARAKINILYNRTGKTNTPPADDGLKKEINQLPPDARFKITSIASEKRISSLVVADLNGDGLPDLAYYGDPKELVVLYNLGTNGWSVPKRFAIEDGQLGADALTTGDLHGSGRRGLVLLGENKLYYIAQNADHLLAEPEKIPFSGTVKSLQVLDINGDGRDDLLLINGDSTDPFRFRLQDAQGQLGPETHFTFPPVRAYLADDLLRDHKMELITIAQNSGRAQVSGLNLKPAEPLSGDFKNGQFQVLPLKRTTQSRRGILWADVNGDGLSDLLVAEPDSGQLTLYLQQADGNLGSAKTFPTLSGVTELAVSDWNQDGAPEIFVLSSEEHQIGVTKLDTNGRIAFPAILPFEGRPLAMAVGPLQPGAAPTLAVILDQDGKRVLATRTADGTTRTQTLSAQFKANPASMTMFDANQDGLADLVVLIPYDKIKVLIQTTNNTFDEEDVLPPGGSSDQPWLSAADVDGDGKQELLLAQKNFIRAVVLQPESRNPANDAKPVW